MDGDTHQPGEARNIQAIDKQSVHRICSGQVILSLATAVKELVENSLDAGAKSIEIKLRDYGSELLEVIDNGCGVKEENFEGLTLKHHTSKLQDFSDLVLVDTFGFRGEALSSLCALSNMVITTCHKNTAVATRLEFNHNGKLLVKTPSARQAGTTVSLQNLFSTLPVRHKEFVRNLKKEFNKMVQVLYAYCIISTNVKVSCTNQVGKGKKSVMVNTNGNSTMKENIANLFGAKQMQNLLEFVYADPTEEVLTEYRISLPTHKVFSITGFVSTCVHGHGRSSTDRQFYFINKRPCDLLKVSRVVNEVYHSYNRHQYPFVVLDISLDKESVDVNVTPDKRQIFIENEKLLLAVVKSSLMKLWEPKASVFHLNQAQRPQDQNPLVNRQRLSVGESSKSSPSLSRKENISSALASMKRSFSSAFVKSEVSPTRCTKDSDNSKPNKQRKLDSFIVTPVIEKKAEKEIHSSPCDLKPSSPCKSSDTGIDVSPCSTLISDIMSTSQDTPRSLTFSEQDPISPSNTIPQFSVVFEDPLSFTENTTPSTTKYTEEMCDPVSNMNCVQKSYQSQKLCALKCEDVSTDRDHVLESEEIYSTSFGSPSLKSEQQRNEKDKVESSKLDNERSSYLTETSSNIETSCNYNNSSIYVSEGASYDGGNSETEKIHAVSEEMIDRSDTSEQSGNHMVCKSMVEENTGHQLIGDCGENTEKEILSEEGSPRYTVTVTEQDEPFHRRQKKERRVEFSMSQLKSRLNSRDKSQKSEDSSRWCRSFRAKINPSDNTAAEQELKREISKDMFLKMEILGQFNLGFIIVLLDRDLFIIDQHATDEKYNFEMLQRHTVIQSQKLIQPQNLELTAASEVILMDNLEVFHKNGFDFLINEDAPPTQRVKLVSIPVSKNWTFGKDDIDELLFMLNDSPGVHCRPSRVRMMFASRSCRKSIMIGTALDKPQMRKLVDHMSEIEQPWNCPHGRPTMRHLINLDMLPD